MCCLLLHCSTGLKFPGAAPTPPGSVLGVRDTATVGPRKTWQLHPMRGHSPREAPAGEGHSRTVRGSLRSHKPCLGDRRGEGGRKPPSQAGGWPPHGAGGVVTGWRRIGGEAGNLAIEEQEGLESLFLPEEALESGLLCGSSEPPRLGMCQHFARASLRCHLSSGWHQLHPRRACVCVPFHLQKSSAFVASVAFSPPPSRLRITWVTPASPAPGGFSSPGPQPSLSAPREQDRGASSGKRGRGGSGLQVHSTPGFPESPPRGCSSSRPHTHACSEPSFGGGGLSSHDPALDDSWGH